MEDIKVQISIPIVDIKRSLRQIIQESIKEQQKNDLLTKICYSKKEFAEAIGKSMSFVDQERRAGRIKWKRNGGTVSIKAEELKKYI